ncbi:MAG: N-acetylmuramoyl-L-alanine amidase [Butyricimonas faecihominis]
MEIIENLLFGDNVKYLQCSKCKVKLSRVDTIVLHSTVGAGAISSALFLGRPDTSVSAHVVVGRDAEVFQLLPFDVKAWHAGKSFHAGRVNLNDRSIGIELDNAGSCNAWGPLLFEFRAGIFSRSGVHDGRRGEGEILAFFYRGAVRDYGGDCSLLKECYGIKYVVRHSDITPRKTDPGPAFPFDELRKRLKF